MATQTTYYEFNKPQGTDLVNPLVDTNPNWDIADNALHELNERSVANCTEIVSLGVHAISRLNTDTKFLKWIATANFQAGDTFTVDGLVVSAATASGEALSTGAYVSGAVILACLNADNSAMTVYVTGTNVASDSARLGGELPSYYATDSDMDNAQTDITNIQNILGNTSIVGIGDGTVTGAIDSLKSALTWKHLDEKAGGTGINLPSSFKEILMIVKYGNHRYSINVPNAEILATDTFYRGGFYFSNSNMDVYTVSVNSNSVTLTQMIASNSDVLSTASLNVYYK